jgi:RHS repeat-associated protein
LKGGQTYYFVQDPVGGSVKGLVRASDNTVQAQYGYTIFGELDGSIIDNVGNELRFGGREHDASMGFYFNRARYFDPLIGRFISEDPIGLAGGINLYTYAGNEPVNRRDPTGMWTECYYLPPATVTSGVAADPRTGQQLWDSQSSSEPGRWVCTENDYAWDYPRQGIPNAGIQNPGLPKPGGGSFSPRPKPKPPIDWASACRYDGLQLSANAAMTAATLGVGNYLMSFGQAVKAGTRLTPEVAGILIGNAMYTPSFTALRYTLGSAGGTPNPFTGRYATAYTVMKVLPYLSLAIDAAETLYSCTKAVQSR